MRVFKNQAAWVAGIGVFLAGNVLGWGATLQLGGDHAIRGEIVAEHRDQVVVDVGYTLLIVPRSAIESIESADTDGAAEVAAEPAQRASEDIFYTPSEGGRTESIPVLSERLGPSVMQIRTPGGLGSGFFINENGLLITNFHVIESETDISIDVYLLVDGQLERRSYQEIRIVALNRFADLALLKVEDEGAPQFQPVVVGSIADLAVGENVFAIGSPLGLERTVTEGIVSTKTREYEGRLYLQTTAQINPGNSGGPLFNRRGEVVGVTNMKLPLGEGLGFAIPAESVRHFIRYREAFAYDNDNPNNPYRYLPPPTTFSELNEAP